MSKRKFEHKATTFSKANLAYLAHCANIVYKSKEEIREELNILGFDVNGSNFFFDYANKEEGVDTQCFIAGDSEKIIISFRGSEKKLGDWATNKRVIKTNWNPSGRVHRGFYRAVDSVWDKLADEILKLRTNNQSLWFTGHSLGGALTTLAAALCMNSQEIQSGLINIYTFGQPRTGNSDFANFYNSKLKDKTYRVVNNNDLVTRVPFQSMSYSHTGSLKYFSADGELIDDGELSWWGRFWDRLKGRYDDLLELGPDSIKDHKMDTYQVLCEKAYQDK